MCEGRLINLGVVGFEEGGADGFRGRREQVLTADFDDPKFWEYLDSVGLLGLLLVIRALGAVS